MDKQPHVTCHGRSIGERARKPRYQKNDIYNLASGQKTETENANEKHVASHTRSPKGRQALLNLKISCRHSAQKNEFWERKI